LLDQTCIIGAGRHEEDGCWLECLMLNDTPLHQIVSASVLLILHFQHEDRDHLPDFGPLGSTTRI
jgi:hypothetical protein